MRSALIRANPTANPNWRRLTLRLTLIGGLTLGASIRARGPAARAGRALSAAALCAQRTRQTEGSACSATGGTRREGRRGGDTRPARAACLACEAHIAAAALHSLPAMSQAGGRGEGGSAEERGRDERRHRGGPTLKQGAIGAAPVYGGRGAGTSVRGAGGGYRGARGGSPCGEPSSPGRAARHVTSYQPCRPTARTGSPSKHDPFLAPQSESRTRGARSPLRARHAAKAGSNGARRLRRHAPAQAQARPAHPVSVPRELLRAVTSAES